MATGKNKVMHGVNNQYRSLKEKKKESEEHTTTNKKKPTTKMKIILGFGDTWMECVIYISVV